MDHGIKFEDTLLLVKYPSREVLRIRADGTHEWFSPSRYEAAEILKMIDGCDGHISGLADEKVTEIIAETRRFMATYH